MNIKILDVILFYKLNINQVSNLEKTNQVSNLEKRLS